MMKSITVNGLAALMESNEAFQLVDVREGSEHKVFNIGGTLIPLGDIIKNMEAIDKQLPVIFYCRMGIRSQIAIQRLQEKMPFNNLFNLTGGMEAWKKEFGDGQP